MPSRPNVVFVLADQLRAASLPLYGETQIDTPHLDRLAREGVTLTNCISNCPVCTPYRAMLITGRYPQATGHIINSTRTRHTEISIADALAHAGYRTGWIGKWHLHTGAWPAQNVPDWVPKGRDRMGFLHWRGYNMHMVYFNGFVNSPTRDFDYERWEGYETSALNRYAFEFMDDCGEEPFAVFLSPHQPHWTPGENAPEEYYERVPDRPELPANVPDAMRHTRLERNGRSLTTYHRYLAMTLTLDDMVGELLDYLARTGRAGNTIVVFTSDHGTQGGAQGIDFWTKKRPYEESLRVPGIVRWPGVLEAGSTCDALTGAVDWFPALCSLCGIPVPQTVEGTDLSAPWRGEPGAAEQDALFCMNFGSQHDYYADGDEWRGVRTKTHQFTRWLGGRVELFDLEADPLQMSNLAQEPAYAGLRRGLEERLAEFQRLRGDELLPGSHYASWVDEQRRVVRNGLGPLSDPEQEPDWSLLAP